MYALERVVDRAAGIDGLGPAVIRRRDPTVEGAFPFVSPVGVISDSGAFARPLEAALQAADRDGFPARKAPSERRGRLRGRGLACWIESSGGEPQTPTARGCRAGLFEAAKIRAHPAGSVTVHTGALGHGRGHETTFAQVSVDKFELSLDQVEVVHVDTASVRFGVGTYGSRSIAEVRAAVRSPSPPTKPSRRATIATHVLEAAAEDITFERGSFLVKGTDRALDWVQMALAAHVPAEYLPDELEPGIAENAFYDPPNFTFPNGVFVRAVEVGPETRVVTVDRSTGARDVGTPIDPPVVERQVRGGVGRAIGPVLVERVAFDERGRLPTGSLLDHRTPRAADRPPIGAVFERRRARLSGRERGGRIRCDGRQRRGDRRPLGRARPARDRADRRAGDTGSGPVTDRRGSGRPGGPKVAGAGA